MMDTAFEASIRDCASLVGPGQALVVEAELVYGRVRLRVRVGWPSPDVRAQVAALGGDAALVIRDVDGEVDVRALDPETLERAIAAMRGRA